jgi:uncharacterized surface protein with fasciclin (FAS1) repeats
VSNAQPSPIRRVARWLTAGLAAALAVAVVSAPAASAQQPQRDIVDTAVAAGQFSTLARAVQAAGLVETLKGPGPFTVFAPTDAAFNKLPAGTLDSLLQNREQLRAVLTYHVIPGRVMANQITNGQSVNTVQGAPLTFQTGGGSVRINNSSTVAQADIMATNGVIHVIDTVLLPPGAMPAQMPRAGVVDPTFVPMLSALFGVAFLAVGGLALSLRSGRIRVR